MTETGILVDDSATGRDDIERLIRSSSRVIGCVAPDIEPGVSVASWLINVSRFVEASGDENPLYTDVQYGAGSAHHTMLAPPTFVLAIRAPGSTGVLDLMAHRLASNLTSLQLSWDDTIRLGDTLTGRVCVGDVARRYTETGRVRACVVSTVEYQRTGVGFARGRVEVEIAPLDEATSFSPRRPIHRYEPADVEQLVRELEAEQPFRGAVWVFAEGRPVRAGNLEYARLAQREGRRATHPLTGWPVWDRAETSLDSAVTAPAGPAAPAGLLVTLAGQHVTHWIGDDGFLRQLSARIQRSFRYGDLLRLTGTVMDRDIRTDDAKNRYHTVTLRVVGTNQLGESVIEADAVVFLPDHGKPVRLPVRGGLSCDTPLEK